MLYYISETTIGHDSTFEVLANWRRGLLTHFDPSKLITVTCDASDDGIAGVLSHNIEGKERPVFFVSRRLSKAERNYPILHREALAIVFAMEKFYKYVLGQKVIIVTDHKPLLGVFQSKKNNHIIIANRLQRYVSRLSIFEFTIIYKPGRENHVADCLSRLPLNEKPSQADLEESSRSSPNCLNFLVEDHAFNLNARLIAEHTKNDQILNLVIKYIRNGWPTNPNQKGIKNYFSKKHELNVEADCLIFRDRVIIPDALKEFALQLLHANHRGSHKMKLLSRQFLYWEGIGKDIENYSSACKSCQLKGIDRTPKIYGNWPKTTIPFERIHIDFFQKFNRTFLILIDAYSRWIEISRMKKTAAEDVALELDNIFARFGFPSCMVSDNGPPFNSVKFAQFCKARNIEHIFSPPYHPASNGLAERAVQTTKAVLDKIIVEGDSYSSLQIDHKIRTFLHHHHQTPTTGDNIIPNERIFAFKPRTELVNLRTKNSTFTQSDQIVKELKFKVQDNVIYTQIVNGRKYSYNARIIKPLSKLVYLIEVEGSIRKAHMNQLKKIPQTHFHLKNTIDTAVPNKANSSSSSENSEDELDSENSNAGKIQNKIDEKSVRRSKRTKSSRHSNLNLKRLVKKR